MPSVPAGRPRRTVALAVAVLLAVPQLASAGVASPGLTEQRDVTYVALGDSVAFGMWDIRGGYVDRLAARKRAEGVSVTVDNRAVPGWRTRDLLASLRTAPTRAALRQADVITVSIGGNDLRDARARYRRSCTPPEAAVDRLVTRQKRVFRLLRKVNATATTITMTTYNPYVRVDRASNSCPDRGNDFRRLERGATVFNAEMQARLGGPRLSVVVADVFRAFNIKRGRVVDPRAKGLLSFDGLHPNQDGHARVAAEHRPLW